MYTQLLRGNNLMCRFKFLISELLTSSAEFFATLNVWNWNHAKRKTSDSSKYSQTM